MRKKKVLKQKNYLKIYKILIVISLLLFVVVFLKFILNDKITINEEKKINNINLTIKDNPQYKLSLVMVGDALIHDDIYLDARINRGYDFTKMLSSIKEIVQNYDLAYYNQETILGGTEIGLSSYPAFNSPYEVGDAFVDAGFNLVSLATNHTLDRGTKAVINSRNYWNSKNGVLAVGSYSSSDEKSEIKILNKNNISYTMLNYTYGTNGIKVPSGKEYLVNVWPVTSSNPNNDTKYQNYKEIVKNDISLVRDKVDLLIVAMHWGIEYQTTPNNYQKDMANYLSSLGVDIIIGTHPHVIQPIEWINDTLVIYSLGNFISAHEVINMDNRVGLMSSVNVTKTINEDKTTNIKIDNLNNELLYTYYTKNYKDFKVIPFSELTVEYLDNYRSIYPRYRDIITSLDSSISVNPID